MDTILPWDTSVFLWVNHIPHTVIFDSVAMFFSGIGSWGVVWFVIAILLFLREEKKDHLFFYPFVLSGISSWIVSEIIVKWIIARPRPSEAIGALVLTTPGNFSFPSTHATLAWAMATVLSKHEPPYRYWFYTLAVIISISRIYLGAHYPADVLCGAILGNIIGLIANSLEFLSQKKPYSKKRISKRQN